jgi:nucleoside-triphosphatase
MASTRILLITGAPGVGKTTVLRRVSEALRHARIGGFYTEELREHGVRRGFRAVGFEGSEAIIAHVDLPHRQRVGKYAVDVAALDRLARNALALREDCAVYLVDEIGKMECLSPAFVAAMRTLLASRTPLVATIARKGGGFIQEVRSRRDVGLLEVTPGSRDGLAARVLDWLATRGVDPAFGAEGVYA